MPEDTDHPVDLAADRGITAFMRARTGRELHRSGPFLLMFTPGTASRWLNHAIPDDGAHPTAAHIDAMITVFDDAGSPRVSSSCRRWRQRWRRRCSRGGSASRSVCR